MEYERSPRKRPDRREILFSALQKAENAMEMPAMPSKAKVKDGLELIAAIFAAMKSKGLVNPETARYADMGITLAESMLGIGSVHSEIYAANATEFAHPLVSWPASHDPAVVGEWVETHPATEGPFRPAE